MWLSQFFFAQMQTVALFFRMSNINFEGLPRWSRQRNRTNSPPGSPRCLTRLPRAHHRNELSSRVRYIWAPDFASPLSKRILWTHPLSLSLSSPPEGAFNYGGGDALAPRCDRKRGPDVKYDARSNFNYAMQQPWIVATGSFRHIGLIHVIRATLIKPGNAVSLNPPVECKMRLAR